MMSRRGVLLLFFFSGVSALVYQAVWVRYFGVIFGKTVYSASVVTAVFMAGLGIGGHLAGRYADRRYLKDPGALLRSYAFFEIGIGGLAALVAVILPRLEPLSALFSSYVTGDDGWQALTIGSQLVPYVIAVLLLLPVTCLMGGTLTLLIRHLVRSDLTVTGSRVGALYGLNTAGAALGALLVDFLLVPELGLNRTQAAAVLVNLAVGAVALRWAGRSSKVGAGGVDASQTPKQPPGGQDILGDTNPRDVRRLMLGTATAIFLSGFAAMGMEILWFRYLISALGSNRAIFSLLLSVMLCGMWLGSMMSGAVQRRLGHPALVYLCVQALFATTTLGLLAAFNAGTFSLSSVFEVYEGAPAMLRSALEVWAKLRLILVVVGIPSVLMGFAFPVANVMIQRSEASVGARAGAVYLANTAGAVLGSLLTGFVLLPALGMQTTAGLLAALSVSTLLPLSVAARGAGRLREQTGRLRVVAHGLVLVAGITMIAWTFLPAGHLTAGMYRPQSSGEKLLVVSEGVGETIWITDGPGAEGRTLYTNGHAMSGTSYGAQRYMRAFVHIPMLQMERGEDVLVICFGVGNTAHAASLHPSLRRLEVVDLSRHVVQHADYFERWNRGVLRDSRVKVFINDGRQHLRAQAPQSYDLVTLEPPPINHAGVASLYSQEFYELARDRLRPGGFMTQWLPVHQVPDDVAGAIVGAFVAVFPDAIVLSGFQSELILMGRKGQAPKIDPGELQRRLRERPEVLADLVGIDLASLTELIGTFAGPSSAMVRAAAGVDPITDDNPAMEYSVVSFRGTTAPQTLFDVEAVDQWCPTCRVDGELVAQVAPLASYLQCLDGYYRSLVRTAGEPQEKSILTRLPVDPETFDALRRRSGYLQRLYGVPE